VVAQPSLPNLFLQASKTKPKAPRMIQDQSSTVAYLYDHERESIPLIPESFRAKNGCSSSPSRKINFIVKLLQNSIG